MRGVRNLSALLNEALRRTGTFTAGGHTRARLVFVHLAFLVKNMEDIVSDFTILLIGIKT
jgi:hypothetical protein